ncbi:MAG: toxin [Acidobacteriota bacterium]|nr:toxin [Acidobacteriota bacterium]
MKYFAWDDAKNAKLRADRDIGFGDIVFHIERRPARDPGTPEPDQYAGHRIIVVQREGYVYFVPCVEDEHRGKPAAPEPSLEPRVGPERIPLRIHR